MGLAQAVSLPRGGGTLKGQCPLPAAAGRSLSSQTPLPSRPLDPFPRGYRRPKLGSRREGTRGGGPGDGAAPGGGGHVPREPGGQEVRLPAGLGRLGRAGLCARCTAGVVRREPRESQEEKDKEEKE